MNGRSSRRRCGACCWCGAVRHLGFSRPLFRAARDGATRVCCEERHAADGSIARSVTTWHHAGQGKSCRRQPQRARRASRRSRVARRRSRASGSGVPLGNSAQQGNLSEGLPAPRSQNARQRKSAQRSAENHAKLRAAHADAVRPAAPAATTPTASAVSAVAPSSPPKRPRGDDEPAAEVLLSLTSSEVAAPAALPQRPRKGLRAGFLLGLLLPLGFM